MGGVNFQSPSKKLAAREVLVIVTEDDCFGQSNSNNREGIYGGICAYRGKTRFRELLWEKRVSEDELQEEDHLGKQPFVPKAILQNN